MVSWQINGLDLDNATVKVVVTPSSLAFSEAMRRQDIPLLHGTMKSHLLGRNLPAWKFKFEFVGPSPDRYTRLLTVRNQIRGFATFELEAPSDSEVVFEDNVKSITLSMVTLRVSYGEGVDSVVMEVDALHVDPDDTSGLGSGGVIRSTLIATPIFTGRIQQPIVASATMTPEPIFTPTVEAVIGRASMTPTPIVNGQVAVNRGPSVAVSVTAAVVLAVPDLGVSNTVTAAQALGASDLGVSNTVTAVPSIVPV